MSNSTHPYFGGDRTPKHVSYAGITFDSQAEADLYRLMTAIPGIVVECHKKIVLRQKNNEFPPITWNVDFWVKNAASKKEVAIEYKGNWIGKAYSERRVLLMQMRLFRELRPDVALVLTGKDGPASHLPFYLSISDTIRFLRTL